MVTDSAWERIVHFGRGLRRCMYNGGSGWGKGGGEWVVNQIYATPLDPTHVLMVINEFMQFLSR